MRPLSNASMTDPIGASPQALARAHVKMIEACTPDSRRPERAPLPLVPVAHAVTLHSSLSLLAGRQSTQALQAAAALPALSFQPAAIDEGMAFAVAITQQFSTLQGQWMQGLIELGQEMGEMRQVNTVTKLVDQEMNLLQQGFSLVSSQMTATVRVMENIQVNVAWWLSRKAG